MISISRIAALILLAVITFSTLSPIQMRPHLGEANFERSLAYIMLGFALALGFPKRLAQTLVFVTGVAGTLELLQLIFTGRHARFEDASIKALAGIAGIVLGSLVVMIISRSWTR
jgi:hypothetical protein